MSRSCPEPSQELGDRERTLLRGTAMASPGFQPTTFGFIQRPGPPDHHHPEADQQETSGRQRNDI